MRFSTLKHICISSSILLLVCACQTQPPPRAVAVGDAATLHLPADWIVEPSAAGLLFARPTEQGHPVAGAFLLVSRDAQRAEADGAPSLAGYVAFKESQARAGAVHQALLDRRATVLDGVAAEMRLRHWARRTEQRRSVSYMAVKDGEGWIVVGSARSMDFPRLRRAFEQAARSLQWRP